MSITYEANAYTLDNVFIKLYIDKYEEMSADVKAWCDNLLTILTQDIGAKTDVNYHAATKAIKGAAYIPIYYYNDNVNNNDELIDKRIQTIVNYFNDIDILQKSNNMICLFNVLMAHNVNVNTFLKMQVVNRTTKDILRNVIDVHIKVPLNDNGSTTFKRINVDQHVFKDGSKITLINDKCASTYGIFVNLTVPFKEMGMSYNALHLYEHLMMNVFKDGPEKDVVEANGSTYPNGLCFVYNIHNTYKSFKVHLNGVIKELLMMRNKNYWNEHKEDIIRETKRTISETRLSRSLNDMGRSDIKAFLEGYNTDIFKYWSNKPFDIIISGCMHSLDKVLKLDIIEENIKAYCLHNISRPSTMVFNNIPIDVIRSKEVTQMLILKESSKNINAIFNGTFKHVNGGDKDADKGSCTLLDDGSIDYGVYGYLYGLDNKIVCLSEDFGKTNTYVTFMMLNSLFTKDELEDILNRHLLPMHAELYGTTPFF